MNTSERFLRFAAECVLMAKFTPSHANEMVWRCLAERWVRVLNCLNGNAHWLTLLDLRSDTGNPNSIGFIRALLSAGYGERRPWHWGPNAFISRRLISRLNGK